MTKRKEVQVFKTIDEIGKELVDSIADDGFFTYGYFKTLETLNPFNITPLYFALYDEDRIAAFAPCYIDLNNQISAVKDKFPFTKAIVNAVNSIGFYLNNLVCLSPNSFHSKILLGKNYEGKMFVELVSKKIDDFCRKERILFSSFLFVPESERLLIETLQDIGYLKFPSMNTFYLDIQWLNFDDYWASLSYKMRKNVKREIEKCKQSGVTITEENEFGHFSTTLSNLHSKLFSKYNKSGKSPYDAAFFRKLSEYAKDKTRVFVARRDSKMVGFCLYLQHKGILDVYMCGFDYDVQMSTDYTYFNIVYYTPIRLAIEEGIKRINFSVSSERIKLKRGCKLEKTYSLVKCQNKLFEPLYRLYMKRKFV